MINQISISVYFNFNIVLYKVYFLAKLIIYPYMSCIIYCDIPFYVKCFFVLNISSVSKETEFFVRRLDTKIRKDLVNNKVIFQNLYIIKNCYHLTPIMIQKIFVVYLIPISYLYVCCIWNKNFTEFLYDGAVGLIKKKMDLELRCLSDYFMHVWL